MSEFFQLTGPWFWWILAGILLVGELLMPGFFMIWLAAAAALTGAADAALGLGWQVEVLVFGLLSLVLVGLTWKWVVGLRHKKTDQPHLNQRHGAYVGRTFTLQTPIINGTGKLRIDDTLWDVDGPNLPAGASILVTGTSGMRLQVNAVEQN